MAKVETQELIIVKQLPIIEEQLKLISAEIDEKLSVVDGLIVSEDTLKSVKDLRAEFNKDFALLEEKRKEVKTAVTDPYTQFMNVYKECVSDKFNAADKKLKTKIDEVTESLRKKMIEKIRVFFNEYAAANGVAEYADYDVQMSDLTRAKYTKPEFQRICRERIDPLVSGLEAIKAQPEELQAEIMAEFKECRSATKAITIVSDRHKKIEEQKKVQEQQAEQQAAETEVVNRVVQAAPAAFAPPTAVPKQDDDPIMQVTFTTVGKRSTLRKVKAYLEELKEKEGLKYE